MEKYKASQGELIHKWLAKKLTLRETKIELKNPNHLKGIIHNAESM